MASRDSDAVTAEDRPVCPVCGRVGVPLLLGLPTAEARSAADDGALVLGGCIMPDDAEGWACAGGHRWRADDDGRWGTAIRLALRGRPWCPLCGGPSVELLYPADPDHDMYAEDLREGDVVLAASDPPPDEVWPRHRCQRCQHSWPWTR